MGCKKITYQNFSFLELIHSKKSDHEEKKRINYYPFGLKHKGYNNVSNSSNIALDYKYNGIELEEALDLNLYEMNVRNYDPALARWTSIDPVTHHSMSTYNAFDNNPVLIADPSGADGNTSLSGFGGIVNWNGHGGEDKKKKSSQDKKEYQTYNVVPFDDLNVINDMESFTYETGYGEDPHETQLTKREAMISLLQNMDDASKLKLLTKLGVGLKAASKFMKNLPIMDLNPMAINEGFLDNMPVLGPVVSIHSDKFESEQRSIYNEIKWDNVMSSYNDLMDQVDLENVILIYTNQNLFEKNSINGSDVEVLDDRYPTQDYKHLYFGTQTGNNLYIFGRYDNKN